MDHSHQAPLSTGFSRREYWSGLPSSLAGDLPDPGIEPESLVSPALAGGFLTTSATWEALMQFLFLTIHTSLTVSRFNKRWARCTEKATAPHSSTLAWKIPWAEEPGALQSMGSRRVGQD